MQLEQEFSIPVPVEQAWEVLLDVERVAPCFPGATLGAVDGDTVTGTVKVKLGPVLLTYSGVAEFTDKDAAARRVAIDARGNDVKGNGGATAQVVAVLTAVDASSTRCTIVTDLNVTGRPAQFGRGLMLEIGNKILGQFSHNLAESLAREEPASLASSTTATSVPPAVPSSSAGTSNVPTAASAAPAAAVSPPVPEVEPLDLLGAARGAAAKRLAPVAVVLVAVVGLAIWLLVR